MEIIMQVNEVRTLLEVNPTASHNLQQLVSAHAIFGFRKGSLTVHYDPAGRIQKIISDQVVYPVV